MTDTAQPFVAAETDPNAQLETAADAFKAFLNPSSVQPRDESGRFASTQQPEETAETQEETPEAGQPEEGEETEVEADEEADEAAPEAQPKPPSWGAEDEELWNSLPPAAQARIAEREGERDRGLNLKLQETANARKSAEIAAKEAQTKRDDYLAALETVKAIYETPKPDPRAFGYGTAQYNEAAHIAAHRQWEQNSQALAQLEEQRQAITKEAAEEEAKAFSEWKQQHEAEYAPKFLADVPDLKDAAKAEPVLRDLVSYAIANGIPENVFAEDQQDQITSAQLHILWKAQQFDKLKATKAVPKPKPAAGPAVKPGVSSPRSAQKAARSQQAMDRLAREGSIEAGAAVFKNLFKGSRL
jgi:hypothetical protein